MSSNREELKNKIIYRASYRGTKEMDILMSSFVKSIIDKLDVDQLQKLNILVNLGDEDLMTIKKKNNNKIKIDNCFQPLSHLSKKLSCII